MPLTSITPEAWRWIAVIVGLIVGGGLVIMGLIDGNAWISMAGGVLSGGSTVAGVRK